MKKILIVAVLSCLGAISLFAQKQYVNIRAVFNASYYVGLSGNIPDGFNTEYTNVKVGNIINQLTEKGFVVDKIASAGNDHYGYATEFIIMVKDDVNPSTIATTKDLEILKNEILVKTDSLTTQSLKNLVSQNDLPGIKNEILARADSIATQMISSVKTKEIKENEVSITSLKEKVLSLETKLNEAYEKLDRHLRNDVNNDGKITMSDANQVVNEYLGESKNDE